MHIFQIIHYVDFLIENMEFFIMYIIYPFFIISFVGYSIEIPYIVVYYTEKWINFISFNFFVKKIVGAFI